MHIIPKAGDETLISMVIPVIYTSRPGGTPEEMLDAGPDVILKGLQFLFLPKTNHYLLLARKSST
jgi:hypothetical protein